MNKNAIIAVLVVLVLGLGSFLIWQKNTTTEKVIAPVITEKAKENILTPEKNTVYLGEYSNKTVVFSVNTNETDLYKGTALNVAGSVDFRNLVNPKKVYVFSADSVEGPTSFLLNENKDKLYITFNHHVYDNTVNPYTEIVQIDLNKNTNSIVWTNNGLTTIPKGPAFLIKDYNDIYISFARAGCFACGGGAGILVMLNLTSGKFVTQSTESAVGNIQVDINAGTFSYQKLVTVCSLNNTPCEDPYPETKPSGKVYTEKLP